MSPPLRTYGQERLLAAGSNASAYVLSPGRFVGPPSAASIRLGTLMGVSLGFMAAGPEDGTFGVRIYLVEEGRIRESARAIDYERTLLATVALTLGAETGVVAAPAPVTDGERIADTATLTLATAATSPKGEGGIVQDVWSRVALEAYSPADGSAARVDIRDVRQPWGLEFDFACAGGVSAANVLVKRIG